MRGNKFIDDYFNNVFTRTVPEQVYAAVHLDLLTKKLTEKQAEEILTYTENTYLTCSHPHITAYLTRLTQEATPDEQKRAKKSREVLMESFIRRDRMNRKIERWEAEGALAALSYFANNKTAKNEK